MSSSLWHRFHWSESGTTNPQLSQLKEETKLCVKIMLGMAGGAVLCVKIMLKNGLGASFYA